MYMSLVADLILKYEPQLAVFFANRINEQDLEIEKLEGHLIEGKNNQLNGIDEKKQKTS